MQILIIGGTNFIGPHVARRLIDEGHGVTLFHRGQTNADLPPDAHHILGDRQRLADFASEFKRLAPEVVLDMIPYTEPDAQAVRRNFKGIARRVVAISSMDVYRAYDRVRRAHVAPLDATPLTEDSPLREVLYPYRSKAKGPDERNYNYDKIPVEQVLMNDPELAGTILRLPAVYGPGDPQHRVFEYLKPMDDGRPVILLEQRRARWRWTRGYVENVAAAIALALTDERAAGRIYNVGEENAQTETEWIESIGRAAGWQGKVLPVARDRLPEHLKDDLDWEQDLAADTGRIRKELGYAEPVQREEALRRTVAWERAHPPPEVDPKSYDYAAEDAALAEQARQDD